MAKKSTAPAPGSLKLPAIFGSHMVLQRDLPAVLWGWAKPGQEVTVAIGQEKVATNAGTGGRWQAMLGARQAGGPHEIVVAAGRSKIKLEDVLFGDVWVCSGQSNMEFALSQADSAAKDIPQANFPAIRLFNVAQTPAVAPADDCQGRWGVCDPATAMRFSAVGYYFGRRLHQELGVPMGLINSSWGGTIAEAWTALEDLAGAPALKYMADGYQAALTDLDSARSKFREAYRAWEKVAYVQDPGNEGIKQGWHQPGFDDAAWKTMPLPAFWEGHGLIIDGAVWFRTVVDIPRAWAGKDLDLGLGAIDDFDVTYFDGEKVGAIGEETPNWWTTPRQYTVPGNLVKAGKATLAVRVFDRVGSGGFGGPAVAMRLGPGGSSNGAVSLVGPWKYCVEYEVPHSRTVPPMPPVPPGEGPNSPTVLYNGMIHCWRRTPIKGAIWYQGESNADRAHQYRTLLPTMIRCWRRVWGIGDFPFIIVQLANFMPRELEPIESDWAELREAQSLTAANVPNCGLAVATDIGDAADIHPKNKKDVGERLALWALANTYGKKIVCSGPTFKAMKIESGKARLTFTHIGGGLERRAGSPSGFAIAGKDRKFVWADAQVDGACVIVSNPRIADPVAVRYGWSGNPPCTLYNKEGLPASPFRTDDWPGITGR